MSSPTWTTLCPFSIPYANATDILRSRQQSWLRRLCIQSQWRPRLLWQSARQLILQIRPTTPSVGWTSLPRWQGISPSSRLRCTMIVGGTVCWLVQIACTFMFLTAGQYWTEHEYEYLQQWQSSRATYAMDNMPAECAEHTLSMNPSRQILCLSIQWTPSTTQSGSSKLKSGSQLIWPEIWGWGRPDWLQQLGSIGIWRRYHGGSQLSTQLHRRAAGEGGTGPKCYSQDGLFGRWKCRYDVLGLPKITLFSYRDMFIVIKRYEYNIRSYK